MMGTYMDKLMEDKRFKQKFEKEYQNLSIKEDFKKSKVIEMKLKLKKDIVIPKGTIFENIDNTSSKFIYDNYDFVLALDNDTCARVIVSSENDKYFEVISDEKR